MPRGFRIPRSSDRIALENPDESKDYIGDYQKYYRPLNRPYEILLDWNAKQEETDGYLGKHQGLKSLDPFAIRILHELNELPFRQIGFVSSEAIVDLDDDKTSADDDSESGAYDGVVVPAYTSDYPNPGG